MLLAVFQLIPSVILGASGVVGNVVTTLHGYVNQQIEFGETVSVIAQTDIDVHKMKASYNVNYIVHEEGDGE